MTPQADKIAAFRALHTEGCFLLPNPWDAGSARYLQALGFKALASTSAGFAWSMGRNDYGLQVDEVVAHLAALCAATDIPVNADFEGGFAVEPEGVAANVMKAAEAGVAGLSIEDRASAGSGEPLIDLSLAAERIRAAAQALRPTGVLLTARYEGFLLGRTDVSEAIARLTAYAEAGAECLFAPGLRTDADIRAVVAAVAPLPVNVISWEPGWTPSHLEALGVRRVSIGGALARTAYGAAMSAAKAWLDGAPLAAVAPPIPMGEVFKG